MLGFLKIWVSGLAVLLKKLGFFEFWRLFEWLLFEFLLVPPILGNLFEFLGFFVAIFCLFWRSSFFIKGVFSFDFSCFWY